MRRDDRTARVECSRYKPALQFFLDIVDRRRNQVQLGVRVFLASRLVPTLRTGSGLTSEHILRGLETRERKGRWDDSLA